MVGIRIIGLAVYDLILAGILHKSNHKLTKRPMIKKGQHVWGYISIWEYRSRVNLVLLDSTLSLLWRSTISQHSQYYKVVVVDYLLSTY